MFDFFYYLCIFPLESFMHLVLNTSFAWTQSWGISLVLLSLVVNILLLPLYHMAENWQEAERQIQTRMAPKLTEIHAVFKGQERYMMVRTLYRQHGYHPIMAVRTSVGFLIQVPFFFAAFHLLNDFPPLHGMSLMGIADLSRPDALLSVGGLPIHILPFAMTAANLISAAVYSKRLTTREKRQLWGIALLFLVLLYTSSAALLIYWTCNNLFSLIKNIIYVRWVYDDSTHAIHFKNTTSTKFSWVLRIPNVTDTLITFAGIACFIGGVIFHKRHGINNAFSFPLFCTAAALLVPALLIRLTKIRTHMRQELQGILGLAIVIGLLTFVTIWGLTPLRKLQDPLDWRFYRLMAVISGLLATWLAAQFPINRILGFISLCLSRQIPTRQTVILYFGSIALFLAIVFGHIPALFYSSDPDFFYESVGALFAGLTLRSLIVLFAAYCIIRATPVQGRALLAATASLLALAALAYAFVIPVDYGPMDEFTLMDTSQLKNKLAPLMDAGVFASLAFILYFIIRKHYCGHLAQIYSALTLVLILHTGYTLYKAPDPTPISPEELSGRLPEYNNALFSLSKDGTNIFVILLDMFTGSHMERLLQENPSLMQSLDGFTWYADTVATGSTTTLSNAAMLGGEKYTATAINERKPARLLTEINKAYSILPNVFLPRNYRVTLAEMDELKPALVTPLLTAPERVTLIGRSIRTAYSPYWRKKLNLPSQLPSSLSPFLAAVGLFRAAPLGMRLDMYDDAAWAGSLEVKPNRSEGPMALLSVLPDVSNTQSQHNTFTYMASQVTHYPWLLNPTTCMPLPQGSAQPHNAHYVNESCALRALSRWFAWMKESGVYDNTQIILASDHSAGDTAVLGKDFDPFRNGGLPWRPDALLLVKNRNERGELRIDKRPMSSSDVPALICRDNGPCPDITDPDPLSATMTQRVRMHSSGHAHFTRHQAKERFDVSTSEVTGSMFDPKNWKKLTGK